MQRYVYLFSIVSALLLILQLIIPSDVTQIVILSVVFVLAGITAIWGVYLWRGAAARMPTDPGPWLVFHGGTAYTACLVSMSIMAGSVAWMGAFLCCFILACVIEYAHREVDEHVHFDYLLKILASYAILVILWGAAFHWVHTRGVLGLLMGLVIGVVATAVSRACILWNTPLKSGPVSDEVQYRAREEGETRFSEPRIGRILDRRI